uniref:Membrane-associated kinase regulator 4 n=1 Tax=Cajanus cajan TaxID=3821 RepID=A0A151RVY8_CAJCA|nr:hypothetical protein KK1_031671 [Cajanus cajan]
MATKQVTLIHVDDDYIDMELCSSPNFFSYSLSSPPSNREFEFQMNEKESSASPADDLFYKGKLLPLHLPPRLQMMKQFWLGQRLKASRAYLKTLFNKSGCSDKFCASAASNMGVEKKSKEILEVEDDFCDHRRSFSGVGQRHCATKASSLSSSSSGSSSSSSSFSFSSAGYYDLQLFKRSISANYELESSIEGAIAHCKQSQQHCSSKNGSDDSRICSQFATKMQLVGVNE